jgi:hypothetical protein
MSETYINIIHMATNSAESCNTHSVARAAAGECCLSEKDLIRTETKGNNTMFSLAKANPSKTYNELRSFVERRSNTHD